MRKLPKIFMISAIVFTFCAASIGAQVYTGEVSVGDVSASPGDQAAVPVYLSNNNIELMSLTVPLEYSSGLLEVDSVSFAGTLLKPTMSPLVNIDNDARFVRFTYYPGTDKITESEGLLATIYFKIDPSAIEQTVTIDSVYEVKQYEDLGLELWTRVEVADSTGFALYFPDFYQGSVTILPPADVDDEFFGVPKTLELKQNFPNPFNPVTTIAYSVPERSHVRLKVYNILGQEVATLVDRMQNAGEHQVAWEASNQASGVYFYRLSFQNKVLTKKMALLK